MRSNKDDSRYSQIQELIQHEDFKTLRKETSRFNVFEVLRSTTSEIKHSNVLAWLLDPFANHSCGNAFLKQLLVSVIAESGMSDLSFKELYMLDLDRVQVHREWPSTESAFEDYDIDPNEVKTKNSKKRIDIVITIKLDTNETEKKRTMDSSDEVNSALESGKEYQTSEDKVINKVVIAIENKIHSGEGTEQLKNYNEVLKLFEKDSHLIRIFLTPEGIQSEMVHNWHACSYKQIYRVILETLDRHRNDIQAEKRMLIEQYIELLDAYIIAQQDDNRREEVYSGLWSSYPELIKNILKKGRESSTSNLKNKQNDYDELCAFLYQEHKSAFERLGRYMRSNTKRLCQFLTEYMQEKGFSITNVGRTSYPTFTSERLKEVSQKIFNDKESIVLSFVNRLHEMDLPLLFTINSESRSARRRLYSYMKKKNSELISKNLNPDKLGKKQTTLKSVVLCKKSKADELVFEKEIFGFIKKNLEDCFEPRGMVSEISKFLTDHLDEIVKECNS